MRTFNHNACVVFTLVLLCLAACQEESSHEPVNTLPAGVTEIASSTAGGDELNIPFHKYRLANGLTVILHEDHSDPLVHVDVTYHVGSAREEVGKSGFAHFFEHMMFQGSQHVGDDEHFSVVQSAGGSVNGTTNRDRTNYFETLPANYLEQALWLEADRMGFLLPAVTQDKFEVQRDTVKNERAERYDNRPYGLVRERLGEAVYPPDHPYSWLTIGYIEDLNRVDVNDLKAFFLRWYGPNNAVLTIGGDIDRQQTLAWVAKYFGPIAQGPTVEPQQKQSVTLPETRFLSMTDQVTQPLLAISLPTVHAWHPDEPALDVLQHIIGAGKTSLLHQRLVKCGLATEAYAYHPCSELACTLEFRVLANPTGGKTLEQLYSIVTESIAEFEQRGVKDSDIARVKAAIRSSLIYGLDSVASKVQRLAAYETFNGDPGMIGTELARYAGVTSEDVMRVYEQYVKTANRAVLSVLPENTPVKPAAKDNWRKPSRQLPDYHRIAASDLQLREPQDSFDRALMPTPSAALKNKTLHTWRDELENGIAVVGTTNTEVPMTSLRLQLDAGRSYETLAHLGVAALTASLVNESTQRSSAESLTERLQQLGSSIRMSAGDQYAQLRLRSLTEHLDATLAIAVERLLEPKFDAAEFARLHNKQKAELRASQKDGGQQARLAFNRILYGNKSLNAFSLLGTEASLSKLDVDDARTFFERHYAAKGANIAVVSNLSQQEVMQALQPLSKLKREHLGRQQNMAYPKVKKATLYLVDRPNSPQSHVVVGRRALRYDAVGEFYRANLTNYPFGGRFNSRLNLNLREDKAITYGARSGFSGNRQHGRFAAQSSVRQDATALAVSETLRELTVFAANGMAADELVNTKAALRQANARRFETHQQLLGALTQQITYDLPDDYLTEQASILADFSQSDAADFATRYFDPKNMVAVVVGDKAKIEASLAELDLEVEVLALQ